MLQKILCPVLLLLLLQFSIGPAAAAGVVALSQVEASLYFSQGGGAKQAILAAINGAQKSIFVHSFFLSDREIAKTLINAHERGVYVEALLCRRGQLESLDPQGRYLHAAGIPVFLNGRFRAEHNKVMLFDGETVQTGSYNYRFDADVLDAENIIFVQSPELVAAYMHEYARRKAESVAYDLEGPFNERDEIGEITDTGVAAGHHLFFDALTVEVAFIPGNAKEAIIRHMDNAVHSLVLHTYYLSDPDIAAAVVRAGERGLHVEAVLSAKASQKDPQEFLGPLLVAKGMPVWLDPEHRNAHNKVIVYDNKIVQTGSYNLKNGVDSINAENVLFVHSPELARIYMENYEKHKAHSVFQKQDSAVESKLSKSEVFRKSG